MVKLFLGSSTQYRFFSETKHNPVAVGADVYVRGSAVLMNGG